MYIPGFEQTFKTEDVSLFNESVLLDEKRNKELIAFDPISAKIKFSIEISTIKSGISEIIMFFNEGVIYITEREDDEEGNEILNKEREIFLKDYQIFFERTSENTAQFIPYTIDIDFKTKKVIINY